MSRLTLHVTLLLAYALLGSATQASPIYVLSFGDYGTGSGQFNHPSAVAVDSSGIVYVAETGQVVDRIQKFDSSGTYLGDFGGGLSNPTRMVVDTDGNVHVLETYLEWTIKKFDTSGSLLSQLGGSSAAHGFAVDSNGIVYVAHTGDNRIGKYDSSGTLVGQWGDYGTGDGQFHDPYDVAVDSNGIVYVVDRNNKRIQKFDSSGTYLGNFEEGLSNPVAVVVDFADRVYLANSETDGRIRKYADSGILQWSMEGLHQPPDVAVGPAGNIYVPVSNPLHQVSRWFDVDAMQPGVGASFVNLTIWSDPKLGDTLVLTAGKSLTVTAATVIEQDAVLTLDGGSLLTNSLSNDGTFNFDSGTMDIVGAAGLTIGFGGPIDTITLPSGKTLNVVNMTTVAQGGSLTVADGTFSTSMLRIDGGTVTVSTLSGVGSLQVDTGTLDVSGNGTPVPISGGNAGVITATGDLSLGDASRYDGFNHNGTLNIGEHSVTLESKAFANLGVLTTLSGGTLTVPNGIALSVGDNIAGAGSIIARVAADFGSTIEATGDLSIGDVTSVNGFTTNGETRVKNHRLTINNASRVTLGPVTILGNDGSPGTLAADKGILIEDGTSVAGFGELDTPNDPLTPLTNNGYIEGDSAANPITMAGYVTGTGDFENFRIAGTFAPDVTSSSLSLGNAEYTSSSVLSIDIAGTVAISGYTQLNHVGTVSVGGTVDVDFVDGFEPEGPDTFTIVTATEGVSGEFDAISDIWISATKYFTLAYSDFDVTLSVELLGDLNGDHAVNGVDVDPFVQSMVWGPYSVNADMNQDGQVNGLDVDPFVAALLGGGGVQAVPEPSTFVLALVALGVIGISLIPANNVVR